MKKCTQIYADIVLSVNGEDMFITARENKITIVPSSFMSGLRMLSNLRKNRYLFSLAKTANNHFKQIGWTIYAKLGIFKLAILGLKGKNVNLKLLLYFGGFASSANRH
jgi:hypothetical protein